MMQKCGSCGCAHHHMVPVFIVLIALVILLGNLGFLSSGLVGTIWPILLGLIGCQKMLGRKCRCCAGSDDDEKKAAC